MAKLLAMSAKIPHDNPGSDSGTIFYYFRFLTVKISMLSSLNIVFRA